mgnify:CR=1 FL=1
MKFLSLIYGITADLIIRYLPNFKKDKDCFVFLAHPRNLKDATHKFPFLKILPKPILLLFLKHMWPVRASEITGFKDLNGKSIKGYFIVISMLPEQILQNKKYAIKKIIQAVNLAEKNGANIVGLGSLIASVTNGGKDLVNKVKINLTTGNTLTSYVTFLGVQKIAKYKNIDLEKETIAVVGATGSIGSAVSKLIAKKYSSKLILVGRTVSHMESLKKEILEIRNDDNVEITDSLDKIVSAGMVIVATASSSAFIKSEHLKNGAIVYDITQPRNVSIEVIKERGDLLMIDGGLVKIQEARINFNVGLPKGVFFSCLTETMILSAEKEFDKTPLGNVDLRSVDFIQDKFNKYKFELYNAQ